MLDAMERYYETTHANVHRGVYAIAEEATRLYEAARANVGRFIGAPDPAREVVFTKNATEALNLVAHSWGRANLARRRRRGAHRDGAPRQHRPLAACWPAERGIELRYLPVDDDGPLDLTTSTAPLDGAKLVAVTAMSNVLGTINPVRRLAEPPTRPAPWWWPTAPSRSPTCPPTSPRSGVDFLAFTAHKMLGPTGIGVLWARAELLEAMPPFLGGGEMILDVRLDGFTTNDSPGGSRPAPRPSPRPSGSGRPSTTSRRSGMDRVRAHERRAHRLRPERPRRPLRRRPPDLRAARRPSDRGGVLSFAYRDVHPHDLSQVLDQYGVCVRAGHHCAKPLMRRLGVDATARASFSLYNDEPDVDVLVDALDDAGRFFG